MKNRQTLILDCSEPLSRAVPHLRDGETVIVTKDGRYYGTIDRQSLLHGGRDPGTTKCETVSLNPPIISTNANLLDRMSAFLLGHFRALPIVDEREKPIGLTNKIDVLEEMVGEHLIPEADINELMNSPVFEIHENETLGRAKNTLKEKNTSRLLVVNQQGYGIGLLWAEDIASGSVKINRGDGRMNRTGQQGPNTDELKVSEFVRPGITTVDQNSNLNEVVQKMLKNQATEIIVLANKKPTGVISALDIFRKVQENMKPGNAIAISGLKEETLSFYPEIEEKVEHVIEKFAKTFDIRSVSFHVKRGKKNFSINLYLELNGQHISIREEGPDLSMAIDAVATELETLLRKKKDMKIIKPRVIKRGEE